MKSASNKGILLSFVSFNHLMAYCGFDWCTCPTTPSIPKNQISLGRPRSKLVPLAPLLKLNIVPLASTTCELILPQWLHRVASSKMSLCDFIVTTKQHYTLIVITCSKSAKNLSSKVATPFVKRFMTD